MDLPVPVILTPTSAASEDVSRAEAQEADEVRPVVPREAVEEAETIAQQVAPKKKGKKETKKKVSAGAETMAADVDASISKEAGPDASSCGPPDNEELLRRRAIGRWAIVQGLQNAKYTEFNGKLVRVLSQRENGQFVTVRPGSGNRLAVRPENLRGLLESFEGCTAGDRFGFDDGEVELLAFDAERQLWACHQQTKQDDGSVPNLYLWVS